MGVGRKLLRLDERGPVWLASTGPGDPDVLVPAEYAPVFSVDLPLSQHRLRLEALPFAVEDRISQSLDDVHVALGPAIGPQRYLASVVDAAVLAGWLEQLATLQIKPRRLLSDASTLPPPEAGADWAVVIDGERALVKTSGRESFSAPLQLFGSMWQAAGRPGLSQVGPEWSDLLPSPVIAQAGRATFLSADDAVDLCRGRYRTGEPALVRPLQLAGGIAAAAALAFTGLLAIDTALSTQAASARKAAARQMLASMSPEMAQASDPAAALSRMLPASSTAARGAFLPTLSRASTALQPVSDGLAVQRLSYEEDSGALALLVEAGDLAALEQVQRALREAGLETEAGGSTVGEGRAEATITVRDSAGDEP